MRLGVSLPLPDFPSCCLNGVFCRVKFLNSHKLQSVSDSLLSPLGGPATSSESTALLSAGFRFPHARSQLLPPCSTAADRTQGAPELTHGTGRFCGWRQTGPKSKIFTIWPSWNTSPILAQMCPRAGLPLKSGAVSARHMAWWLWERGVWGAGWGPRGLMGAGSPCTGCHSQQRWSRTLWATQVQGSHGTPLGGGMSISCCGTGLGWPRGEPQPLSLPGCSSELALAGLQVTLSEAPPVTALCADRLRLLLRLTYTPTGLGGNCIPVARSPQCQGLQLHPVTQHTAGASVECRLSRNRQVARRHGHWPRTKQLH